MMSREKREFLIADEIQSQGLDAKLQQKQQETGRMNFCLLSGFLRRDWTDDDGGKKLTMVRNRRSRSEEIRANRNATNDKRRSKKAEREANKEKKSVDGWRVYWSRWRGRRKKKKGGMWEDGNLKVGKAGKVGGFVWWEAKARSERTSDSNVRQARETKK